MEIYHEIYWNSWRKITLQHTDIPARSKTRKSRKFFSEIFKSEFSTLAVGQNRKLRNKNTRNNISKISEVSEFPIYHFFIFQKTISVLQQAIQYFISMLCFVFKAF